jgi:phosphonate transport system ATP-binding protein
MKEWVEKMIVFDNVSKTYPNGVKGLQNINLTINEGEFVSIIGLSGAGKSTLLRSVNRLEPISTGEIKVNNRSITRASKKELREIRREIGLISQHFNLVKRSTVQKNVLSGRLGYYGTLKSIFGLFTKEDYERTVDALASVGLSDKLHTRSDELSGGQQQRVLIARALVQQAPVILADEPVASLDPITTQKVMDDLKEINETLNKTILVNLHSIPLARDYSTRIIALKAGEVVFDGVPSELTDERLEKIYGKNIFDERQGDVSEN